MEEFEGCRSMPGVVGVSVPGKVDFRDAPSSSISEPPKDGSGVLIGGGNNPSVSLTFLIVPMVCLYACISAKQMLDMDRIAESTKMTMD